MTSPRFKLLATTLQIPVLWHQIEKGEFWWAVVLACAMLAMLFLVRLQAGQPPRQGV